MICSLCIYLFLCIYNELISFFFPKSIHSVSSAIYAVQNVNLFEILPIFVYTAIIGSKAWHSVAHARAVSREPNLHTQAFQASNQKAKWIPERCKPIMLLCFPMSVNSIISRILHLGSLKAYKGAKPGLFLLTFTDIIVLLYVDHCFIWHSMKSKHVSMMINMIGCIVAWWNRQINREGKFKLNCQVYYVGAM